MKYLLGVVGIGCLAAVGSQLKGQQHLPRFQTRVDVVHIGALVSVNGKPVAGLRSSDFELFDNGIRQTLDDVWSDTVPIRVVLAADYSGSMRGAKLRELEAAIQALLQQLRSDDQYAVLRFSRAVRLAATGTGSSTRLVAPTALDAGGTTALYDAAHAALLLARSTSSRSLALIFSDGKDTSSWQTERDLLASAQRTGVVAYAVGLDPVIRSGVDGPAFRRPDIDNAPLRRLAETTGGRLVVASSMERVREAFLRILSEFRHRYVLVYRPHGVSREGWHTIEVKVRRHAAKVLFRRGYDGGRD